MKSKIKLILACILLTIQFSCTKQNIIDSGISKAHFDGTIMQYLRQDDYNWKLTVEMIERAGLTDVFEGRVTDLKEITFFGPTRFSILRYLYDNNLDSVQQLSPEFCKETILKHVIKGKFLKEQVPFLNKQYLISTINQPASGYLAMHSLGAVELRAYLIKTPYKDVPDAGPVIMVLYSVTGKTQVPLASPNIQPKNGVVHSLDYNYLLNNL